MRRLSALFVTFALASLAAAGCGGGGGGGSSGAGTLDVRVTDAPLSVTCFSVASVTVDRIQIQPTGSQGEGGWITVTTTARTYNLLDLAGGISETAAFATLPAGRYHKVRLFISNTQLVWTDSAIRDFTVPSGRIDIDPKPMIVIVPGQTTNLTLDFDLEQSFKVAGGGGSVDCDTLKQPGKILFSPVIRATNKDSSGVVEGLVTQGSPSGPGVPGVAVTATDAADGSGAVSTLTSDGSNGQPAGFYALLLDPGSYTLSFEAPGATTQTATVSVSTGRVTRQDAVLP